MNFKAIIENHTIDIYNYMKHDACKSSKQTTGKALKLNECDNIVVIDVDIKNDLNEEEDEQEE